MKPTLPVLGNQRQKNTRSQVVQQLAAQAAQKRNLGRFARTGQGRTARTLNPFVGAGGRFGGQKGLGRPQMLGRRGLGQGGSMLEAFDDGPAVHVQPPAALPSDYLNPDIPGEPAAPPSGRPSWGVPTPGVDGVTQAQVDSARERDTDPEAQAWLNGESDIDPFGGWAPANQITIGGLIPLGQGMYLNPATGEIMGTGQANRGLAAGL